MMSLIGSICFTVILCGILYHLWSRIEKLEQKITYNTRRIIDVQPSKNKTKTYSETCI